MAEIELPEGWIEPRLGDGLVVDVQPGFACGTNNRTGEGVPHLRPMNVSAEGRIDLSVLKFVPRENVDRAERWIQRGDVLFNNTNSTELVGKTACYDLDEPRAFSNHMTRVRCHSELLDSRFCAHALHQKWREGYFEGVCNQHVSQSSVGRRALLNTSILLPPPAEQKRIVAMVEKLLARVNAARERLAKVPAILKRFRQSVLAAACSGRLTADWRAAHPDIEPASVLVERVGRERREVQERERRDKQAGRRGTHTPELEIVPPSDDLEIPESWTLVPAAEITRVQNGRAFPSKEYCESGIRLLRPGNLHIGGGVEWNGDNTASLPEEWAERYPDYLLDQGELLVNLTAQSLRDEFLGRVCLKRDDIPALLNQRIGRFLNWGTDDLRPYLFIYFKSKWFRSYVNTLDTGSLIRHMHSKQILAHTVPLPPIEEQHEIVRRVGALFKLADTIERRVTAGKQRADKLTQAVLAKAFRGELVPTEAELARREGRGYEPASALLERIRAERAGVEARKPKGSKQKRKVPHG